MRKWKNLRTSRSYSPNSNILLTICLIACSIQISGQEIIKVPEAIGECVIANITPEEARLKAIESAKLEALRLAGVSEIINLTNILKTESSDEDFSQAFFELSSSEISGVITDYEVLQEKSYEDANRKLVKMVVISASVKKINLASDPEFACIVTGINKLYRNNEIFEFTITASKDSYVRVFLIEQGNEVTMIYPNSYEKPELLRANQKQKFPVNRSIEYSLYTERNKEVNNLIFVLSKQNIPFLNTVEYMNVMNWIYEIPSQNRVLELHRIIILNE